MWAHLSRIRAVLAIFCASILAWPAGRALADTPVATRAVVVARDLDTPLVLKLRGELAAQGLESLAVWGPPTAPSPGELTSIARGADARAVLRFDETAGAIEVWLMGDDGASPVLVDTVRWSGPGDAGIAAARAAASLHTALLRVNAARSTTPPAAPPSSSSPPPPSSLDAPPPLLPSPVSAPPAPVVVSPPASSVAPPFARFTLAIGVSAVASAGGIGPSADVSLAGAWHPVAAWSVGLFGQLPVLSSTLTGPGGSAQVGATLLGVEVARALGQSSWKVHPDVGLGAGAVSLHLVGTAAAPSGVTPSVDAWMAEAQVRGGIAVPIASEWRLRADATLALAFPEADVDFGKVRVATWGRPIATGALSVEVVLR